MRLWLALGCVAASQCAAAWQLRAKPGLPPDAGVVRSVLAKYAEPLAREYNMSIALAFFSPTLLPDSPLIAVAAGQTNGGLTIKPEVPRAAEPEDMYVWGSITKMFTGPAILQVRLCVRARACALARACV